MFKVQASESLMQIVSCFRNYLVENQVSMKHPAFFVILKMHNDFTKGLECSEYPEQYIVYIKELLYYIFQSICLKGLSQNRICLFAYLHWTLGEMGLNPFCKSKKLVECIQSFYFGFILGFDEWKSLFMECHALEYSKMSIDVVLSLMIHTEKNLQMFKRALSCLKETLLSRHVCTEEWERTIFDAEYQRYMILAII